MNWSIDQRAATVRERNNPLPDGRGSVASRRRHAAHRLPDWQTGPAGVAPGPPRLGSATGAPGAGIADAVKALRGEGLRVSIDTFDPHEAERGAKAGAELVLSVNRTNREPARPWGCEVVAVPDPPALCEGLADTVD